MIEMLEGARPGGVASFEQPRTAEVAMDRRRKDILRSLANLRTRSTGPNAYRAAAKFPAANRVATIVLALRRGEISL